jgi:hypothetical protein
MCLSVVTLGVAATWGQDEAEKPKNVEVTVVEEEAVEAAPAAGAGPVRETDLKRVEVRIGDDGAAAVVNEGEPRRIEVREGGDVYVINETDGTIVQRVQANPPMSVRARLAGAPVVDAGAREALEKLIAGLKDEVKKLEGDGKKEDAEKKQLSIRALEQLLNPAPRWALPAGQPRDAAVFGRGVRMVEAGPGAEELKKLRERLQELNEQMSKVGREDRPRLEQEMAELQKKMAELHQRRFAVVAGAGPFPPGVPGAPGMMPPRNPGAPVMRPGALAPIAVPGGGIDVLGLAPHGPMGEMDILARRAHALRQAAEQLKQAGLNEQAGELTKQAEKMQAESAKLREHVGDVAYVGVRPAIDLHRSIRELQEQVQQLRREVGELRELLQRQK